MAHSLTFIPDFAIIRPTYKPIVLDINMDALLAMQLESIMLGTLLLAAFMVRFVLVQLALCIHQKALYEQQVHTIAIASTDTLSIFISEPSIISPAQPAFS